MGRKDYSDCISVVKAAIAAGLVHPEKVVVAGRSYVSSLRYTTIIET